MDISLSLRKFRRTIAVIGVTTILASFAVVIPTASAVTVPGGQWYTDSVQQLVDDGLITKDFSPGQPTSRCVFVKFLVGSLGIDTETDYEATFPDVPASNDCADYIYTASANAIVEGNPDGTFRPNAQVTRLEAAVMLTRALGLEEDESAAEEFPDWSDSWSWAAGAVGATANAGIFQGDAETGNFRGGDTATFVETASLVVRASEGGAEGEGEGEPAEGEGEVVVPPVAGGTLTITSVPMTGVSTLADGTAFNPVLKLNLAASSDTAINVTGLTVTRGGLTVDTHYKMSVWVGTVRHGGVIQVSSDHTAEIGMTDDPVVVPAGGSVEVTIAANIAGAADSGTFNVSLQSSANVTSTATTVSMSGPIMGSDFTIVNGANIVATATFDVRSLATATRTVDIGQTQYEMTRFQITEGSSREALNFKSLRVFNNGSSADADLKNLTLKDQSGNTLATVERTTNKYATFTFATPYVVGLGETKYFSLYVDVASGATRTAQMLVQFDYDVELVGASTGSSILATAAGVVDASFPIGDITTGNAGFNHMTINEGALVVNKDNASPSGDVTKGAANVVLGSFKLTASGEDMRVERVAIDLANGVDRTAASNTTGNMDCNAAATCDLIGSVKLVDASTGTNYVSITNTNADLWDSTPAYTDLSSYINVAAGTDKVVNIVGSLSNTASLGTGETISAGVRSFYYYKKSSLKYADSTTNGVAGATVAANQLTVTTSTITVSSNTSFGAQNVVDGTSGAKLCSFLVRAGSAEGVNITSIGVQVNQSDIATSSATDITNFILKKVNADATETQLGSTQGTVNDSTAMSFSVSNFNLAASEQATLNCYGTVGTLGAGSGTITTTVNASGVSGSATQSATAVSGPTAALDLQIITGTTGGTLRVTTATDTPLEGQIVAGTTGNDVLRVKFAASNDEDIYIKEVTLRVDVNADDVGIASVSLYNDTAVPAVLLGSAGWQGDGTNPGYVTFTFTGNNRPKVTKNGASYLMAKIDAVSSSQGAVSGLTPVLSVASVKAEGVNQITPLFGTGNSADSTLGQPADNQDTGCNGDAIATTTATTVTVNSCAATKLAAGMVIEIGSEEMLITALASDGATPTLTVTRGVNGTTAATHSLNDNIEFGALVADATNFLVVAQADDATYDTEIAVGQVIRIGTEDIHVMAASANAVGAAYQNLTVTRAVNNTALATHAEAAQINEWTAVTANTSLIVRTKPTIAAAADSPSGAKSAGDQLLAKFSVTAAANAADPAENSVLVNQFDIRFSRTGVNLSTLRLYPAAVDQNATYQVTPAYWLSGNSARFNVAGNATLVAAGYSTVREGTSVTYTLWGNVTATAQGGNLTVELGNLGTSASATLGAGDAGGDMDWSDAATSGTQFFWVKQGTSSRATLNPAALTFGSASGTLDTTRPVVSTYDFHNGNAAATDDSIDSDVTCASTATSISLVCDHATIVFSEAIDPTTINASLVPAGTVSGAGATLTITSPSVVLGVAATATGGITSSGGNTVITVTGILTSTSALGAAFTATTSLALDALGTTLKIVDVDANADQTVAASSARAGIGTVLKDLEGNFLNTTAPTTSTDRF